MRKKWNYSTTMIIEIISICITSISIIVTIWFGYGRKKARDEAKKLRDYLEFKKAEEFSFSFREELSAYTKMITRPKWKEQIKGRDLVGNINNCLTIFNTYLPRISAIRRREIVANIDNTKKEFAYVRNGDESARDSNLLRLNIIDRLFNEELAEQRNNYIELL